MATPPYVPPAELSRTLSRIAKRRIKHQDTALEHLPDPEQCHPVEMIEYIRRHPASHSRDARRADLLDAQVLAAWLWWYQREIELWTFDAGLRLNMFWSMLGAAFGVGKVGARDRADRHRALLPRDAHEANDPDVMRHRRPDEKRTRDERRDTRELERDREVQQAWIDARSSEISALAEQLVAQADRFELDDDDREMVDEVARELRDGPSWTPGTFTLLWMASNEVKTSDRVVGLDGSRPYSVQKIVESIADLQSQYSGLRKR